LRSGNSLRRDYKAKVSIYLVVNRVIDHEILYEVSILNK